MFPRGWVPSVWIQARLSGSSHSPSGEPNASSDLIVEPSTPLPGPASRKMSHSNDVAAWSPLRSSHRTMWPQRFGVRGFVAFAYSRSSLLVSVT